MRGIVPFSQMGRQDAEQNGQTWGGGKEGENCEEEREEERAGGEGKRPEKGGGVWGLQVWPVSGSSVDPPQSRVVGPSAP